MGTWGPPGDSAPVLCRTGLPASRRWGPTCATGSIVDLPTPNLDDYQKETIAVALLKRQSTVNRNNKDTPGRGEIPGQVPEF